MIGAAQTWLVEECERVLGSTFRSIQTGPGDWSDDYIRRVIREAPTARVVWRGADASEQTSLSLASAFSVYLVTNQAGAGQGDKLRGAGGFAGAVRSVELLAPMLHNELIPDVGRIRVVALRNLWGAQIDRADVAVHEIDLRVPLTLDPVEDESEFVDFLRAGVEWNLPGGLDVAEQTIAIPQEDT